MVIQSLSSPKPTTQTSNRVIQPIISNKSPILQRQTPTPTTQVSQTGVIQKSKNITGSLFKQISDIVTNKLNSVVLGGIQAGIERVKKTPITEFFMPTAKEAQPARQYISDTTKIAVNTIKGAGKLTPAYMMYRAVTGDPVKPKEYAKTILESGMGVLNVSWRLKPVAPIIGMGFGSWAGVRKYFQGKISAGEMLEYPTKGLVEQPFIGETITDNIKIAQAIDTLFVATMFIAPLARKKLGELNLKAEELNRASEILGVNPNTPVKEVTELFRKNLKENFDLIKRSTLGETTPNEEAIRRNLTDAYDLLYKTGSLDKEWATAYKFLTDNNWFTSPVNKPIKPETKGLLPEKTGVVSPPTAEKGLAVPAQPAKVSEVPVKPATQPVPKSLEPLAQEARKYKSAEEFIRTIDNKVTNIPFGEEGTGIAKATGDIKKRTKNLQDYKSQLTDIYTQATKGVGGVGDITDIDKKFGTHNQYVNLSMREEMQQVLKDKPVFIDDSFGGDITGKEMMDFAKKNNLYFGKTVLKEGTGAPQIYRGRPNFINVVAKNKEAFDRVANATTEKELGLALGYKDLKGVGGERGVPEGEKPPEIPKTPSKIAKSIEAKAIEQKLTTRFESIAGYDKITIKEQAKKASALMKDFGKAQRVIRGEEPLPEGLRGTALITAAEEYIKETGDAKLAYELANSPLVSSTSAAAQEMRLAAEREPDSLTLKLQELKKAKEQAVERKTGKKPKEAVKNEVAKIKKQIKTPSKWDWNAFINSIIC